MPNYHVAKNRDDKSWEVKRAGAERISDKADTQSEAEVLAKQFCSNAGGGEVRIHGLDGKIRDSDTVSPGNDPNPPRDRKF
ncbi:DUF2188 domain-containing protein [Candidatus Falkowbacteria bacterium]|nr:DUF2188 domain-containing protein [Candidatus Falkowbacteria bacterium]